MSGLREHYQTSRGPVQVAGEFPTKSAAESARDAYLRNFHPLGYGTSLTLDVTPEGAFRVSGSRAASCE
jgi:hypothetical protein